ncbi:hypothetical protein J3F84DRAFT_379790 [Trichoderma pleuroticola]
MESPFANTPFSENGLSFLELEYLGDTFAPYVAPYSTSHLDSAELLDPNAISFDGTSDTIIPACHNLFDTKGQFAFNEHLFVDSKMPSTQLLSNSYTSPKLGHSVTATPPGDQYMSEANDANPLNGCIFKVKTRQNSLVKDTILESIEQHCTQRRLDKNVHILHTLEKLMTQHVTIYPPEIFGSLEVNVDSFTIYRKFIFDCIDVCLSDQLGVSVFLDRVSLESAAHDALGQQLQCSTAAKALVHMVLALGTHFFHCEGQCERLPELRYNPLIHFNAALKLKAQLLDDIFSVQSLQALIAMTYFGLLIESRETRTLLFNCIQYSQIMRLNRSSSINALCATLDDRRRVKKAFWFLYAMEQRFCLRTETFPLLNHDFVDHEPPKLEGHSALVDWLSILCYHASLCAFILQEFYSQRSLQSQGSSYISDFEEQLRKWMQRLPLELQLVDGQMVGLNTMRSQERRIKLHMFCLYYEILLAVHGKQTSAESLTVTDLNVWPSCGDQQQTSAVKKLLEASHQFTVADVRLDLSCYQLIRVASCKLAASTICDGNNSKDLSYLSMAVGFFGRMAIGDIDGPQEEVTEIVRIVHQLAKENHENH